MPKEALRALSEEILHAQKPLKVLRAINWGPAVLERFFKGGARELPRPEYPPLGFEPEAVAKALGAVKKRLRGRNPLAERPTGVQRSFATQPAVEPVTRTHITRRGPRVE